MERPTSSTPAEENKILRVPLEQWLNEHPRFKNHKASLDLRTHLTLTGRPQTPEKSECSRQILLDEIQLLQLSIHEAGHLVALRHFVDPANVEITEISFAKNLGKGGTSGQTVSGGLLFNPLNQWPQTNKQHHENALMTRAGRFYENIFIHELQNISIDSTDTNDMVILDEIVLHLNTEKETFLKELDEELNKANLYSEVMNVALIIYSKLKNKQYRIPNKQLS